MALPSQRAVSKRWKWSLIFAEHIFCYASCENHKDEEATVPALRGQTCLEQVANASLGNLAREATLEVLSDKAGFCW
jgi:hypothetical protein